MVAYQIPITINILWVLPLFFLSNKFLHLGYLSFCRRQSSLPRYPISFKHGFTFYGCMLLRFFYPADLVPDKYRLIFQLNPMSVIINAYRQVILGRAQIQ